jgi:lipopolysaccharide/colanic/teichoic acid biosynthesis glycosyltransferase
MKRIVDVLGAGLGLILFSPILAVAAIAIRIEMGPGVLFRQRRPGLHAKPFILLKFRTMLNDAESLGNSLPDSRRLTKLGRILRCASIDELPALWNVLVGDMSLIGPRPLLMEYLPLYSLEQARRHEVRPGITGWAQVNGRNAISWEQKFAYDVWYVDHQAMRLDLMILWKTIVKVISAEGISQDGHATMEKFRGSVS